VAAMLLAKIAKEKRLMTAVRVRATVAAPATTVPFHAFRKVPHRTFGPVRDDILFG